MHKRKILTKKIITFMMAVCMLVTALPSVASATEATDMLELLEPMDLGNAIMDPPGAVDYSARSTVNGRDYLYIPIRGKLMLVYDLDAYIADPTNDEAVNVDVADTGFNVPRGVVEVDGYIYVVGDAAHLYKYDPVTNTGQNIDLGAFVDNIYLTIWGLTKDDNGNLYMAAQSYGILKYSTKTGEISTFWNKTTTGTSDSQNRTLVYDDGYIYSGDAGVLRKIDLSGNVVKEADVSAQTTTFPMYLSVVDGIVFWGGTKHNGLIARDIENLESVDIGVNDYSCGGIVTSAGPNGKHYCVTNENGLWEYDPETNTAKFVNTSYSTGLKNRESFIEVNGRDYLFTNRNGKALCQLVDLETYEVTDWADLTDNAGSAKAIRTLNGLPGTSEIYIGGYQTSSLSGYDTDTRKYMNGTGGLFQNPLSQVDSSTASDDKLYLGCYKGGYLVEYDPDTNTTKTLVTCLENTFNMIAIQDMCFADNKLFYTCDPGYGFFGGNIGWYDFSNGRLYVVTGYGKMNDETYEEKVFWTDQPLVGATGDASKEEAIWTDEDGKTWKPTELKEIAYADLNRTFRPGIDGYQSFEETAENSFRGAVYHQNVINVEYHDGYLYCMTSCVGGYNTSSDDDRAQDEAKLMIYNVGELKKEGEFSVRAGSENVIGGIEDLTTPYYISGVQADKNGKLWGLVSETLFSFSYDADAKKVTITEELSFGKTGYPSDGNKQNFPRPIWFDDQGYMYVGFDTATAGIRRIKCSDPSVSQRLTSHTSRIYMLGNDGNLYYSGSYNLMKVSLTEVAKVEQLISAIGRVTLQSGDAINEARTAYSALSAEDKEKVYNYEKLQIAEATFDSLPREYNAEVTVTYDFFNTLITEYASNGYGDDVANLTKESNLNTLNAGYETGEINNVYYDSNYSYSKEYPFMYKSQSGTWKGIMFWSAVGDWIAIKIKSPGDGEFSISFDGDRNSNGPAELQIYILPGETTDVATALGAATAQGTADLRRSSATLPAPLNTKEFEADKEYIVVFKPTIGCNLTTTLGEKARMYLNGLTMSTKVDTLENAQKMATTPFHTVKLLKDAEADAVKNSINSIGTVTLESENAIVAARTAYDALSDLQKALVTNLYILEEAEATLAELKIALGYTASISVIDNAVKKGEKVSINVSVTHKEAAGQVAETGFNAGEISFSYDSSKLAFNKEASTLGEATVSAGDTGVLKLADYGADKSFGSNVYVLVFDAIESGDASVEMTAAAFSNKSNATSNDLEDAKLDQTKVEVSIDVAHAVTLPEGFSGMLIAEDQKDYTFEAVDKNYDYTLSATVGGQAAEVKDNGDGTYTVAAVTADLVISVADKKGKTYGVTFDGTGKDNVTDAEATATYGTNYVFTLPTEEGTVYGMDGITIGGNAYTGYTVSGKTYTIPGSAITGEVVITVTRESVPVTQVSVEVNGTGAGAAAGFAPTAVKNKAYTLTITPEAGCDYQVTATMGGTEVANMTVDGNAYTIPNVTGNIVFTITIMANTDNVSVAEYLTLDGTKMWLVTNATKLAEGKVSTYNGEVMFWSEEYKAYCYLVVADDLQADAAKALVGIKEGTAVTADYGMDVNMTGKVDANDAQLVYNMYNAAYADFDSNVTMEKFLRADVTADQKVDVNDAAAIIAHVLGIASN